MIVAALGNSSVKIIAISARVRSPWHRGNPECARCGVICAPESKKLFVASSKGQLYVYDGAAFAWIKTVDSQGDVDNLRCDAARQRV